MQKNKVIQNKSTDIINKTDKGKKNKNINKKENKSKLFNYAINFAKEYDVIKL